MERRIKERACRHCGDRYQFDIDNIMDDDELMYCCPACANCANTKDNDFWAAPCKRHEEQAEAINLKHYNRP